MTNLREAAERVISSIDKKVNAASVSYTLKPDYLSKPAELVGPKEHYELAQAYLAEHPADEETLVDIRWLEGLRRADGGQLSMAGVRLVGDKFHLVGLGDYVAPQPATRGDVRRYFKAMQVELREGER